MSRQYLIFTAAIIMFALTAACLADRHGVSCRKAGTPKRIGDDRSEAVAVARAQDALGHWKPRYHGRIVLFFDDEWPRFDTTKYLEPPLYRKYPFRLFNISDEIEKEHLDDANFLYIASLRGTVRDIRGVLSARAMADVAARAASAHNARVAAGEVFSTHHGLPRTFTTLAALKQPGEPVLVFVSAGFFRSYEPRDLYRRLAELGIATDSVVVCPGTADPSIGDRERAKLAEFVRLLGAPR